MVEDRSTDFRAQGGDLIIRRFAEHPITQLLIDNQINALFGVPRPVRTDPASLEMEGLKVEQILGTSTNSWGERDYRTQTLQSMTPAVTCPARSVLRPSPHVALAPNSASPSKVVA